jgi:hypothetical protein
MTTKLFQRRLSRLEAWYFHDRAQLIREREAAQFGITLKEPDAESTRVILRTLIEGGALVSPTGDVMRSLQYVFFRDVIEHPEQEQASNE